MIVFKRSDARQKNVIKHSLVGLVAAARWQILLLLLLRVINLGLDVWIVLRLRWLALGWLLIHLLLSTHHWLLLAHHRLLHHRLLHPRLLTHHHLRLPHDGLLSHHRLVHHGLLHHRLHHHWLLLAHHVWLLRLAVDSLPRQHLNVLAQGCDAPRGRHTRVCTCWRPDTLETDLT